MHQSILLVFESPAIFRTLIASNIIHLNPICFFFLSGVAGAFGSKFRKISSYYITILSRSDASSHLRNVSCPIVGSRNLATSTRNIASVGQTLPNHTRDSIRA